MKKQLLAFLCLSAVWAVGQDYDLMNRHLSKSETGATHSYYPVIDLQFETGFNAPPDAETAAEVFNNNTSYWSMTMRVSGQSHGANVYDQLWRYPKMGVGYYAASFFNDSTLGAPNALYAFIDVPITKNADEKTWSFSYFVGAGLSYNFRPNDVELNPVNVVIGSYNNVYIDMAFYSHYKVSPSFDLSAGLGFTHFSNGANNLPNRGMNLMGAKLVVRHHALRKRPTYHKQLDVPEWQTVHQFFVEQAFGSKQVEENTQNFTNTTTSVGYKYWFGYKGRVVGSLDLFYDESNNSGLGPRDIVPVENRGDASNFYSVGVLGGYEAIYKRWSMFTGIGVYVWRNYKYTSSFYERIGMRYRVWDGAYLGVALKAQTFAADYVEWSIGYNF